jgi:TolB protein
MQMIDLDRRRDMMFVPFTHHGHQGLIAYTSDHGGHFDIWLYNPQNGSTVPLTNQLGEMFSRPEWSFDGKFIAFVGKNNIFYVIRLSEGYFAKIDQLEEQALSNLAWSPNRSILAYSKNGQIILYNVVNHQVQRINEIGATDVQWFPNGSELLFQSPDASGISQLFRIRIDGSRKKQITRNTNGFLQNVQLSPDGTYVLYTSPGASISIIFTLELSTGNVFEVKGGPLAKNYYPTWSPNSLTIAFSATVYDDSGYHSQIKTVGRRGENERLWAISTCFATPVTWSTDGRKLAYLSGCNQSEYANEMWVVDLQHPVPVKLVEGTRIMDLQWSPSIATNHPKKLYNNSVYKVRFFYPAHWQKMNEERYEGVDGFFQVSAISAGENIEEVCHSEAFHQLMPYGTNPRIIKTQIQNQEACLILPSADQPIEMKKQSALIVRYPRSIQIGDTHYNYFILWADQNRIKEIAATLKF